MAVSLRASTQGQNTNQTFVDVTIPTGAAADDMIIINIAMASGEGDAAFSWDQPDWANVVDNAGAGSTRVFTQLYAQNYTTNATFAMGGGHLLYPGGHTSPWRVPATNSVNDQAVYSAVALDGGDLGAPQAASTTGSGTSGDPPNLAGGDTGMYFAVVGADSGATISGTITGYSQIGTTETYASNCSIAIWNSDSELSSPQNPGAATIGSSVPWCTATLSYAVLSAGGLGIPIAMYHYMHNTGSNL